MAEGPGFVSPREGRHPLQTKPLLFSLNFKGTKAQVLCSQPFTLGPSEERVAWTGVTEAESGAGGTGEGRGRAVVGFSVLGYTWSSQQPSFLRRSNLSQDESNDLTL